MDVLIISQVPWSSQINPMKSNWSCGPSHGQRHLDNLPSWRNHLASTATSSRQMAHATRYRQWQVWASSMYKALWPGFFEIWMSWIRLYFRTDLDPCFCALPGTVHIRLSIVAFHVMPDCFPLAPSEQRWKRYWNCSCMKIDKSCARTEKLAFLSS